MRMVNAGSYHTCGLDAGGSAWCWGENISGPLGDGTTENRVVPVGVATSRTFAMVSAGCFHTCGVTPAGETFCWGRNAEGQLGVGNTVAALRPLRVYRSP
jgi:alpha-tubulin suppressor-like RCC1 family protein